MAAARLYPHNQLCYLLLSAYFVHYIVSASEHESDSVIERKLSNRLVNTKYGALRGYIATLPETYVQEVEVFLGIPFAQPPTGKLRFMPPVSSVPWNGVRLAHTASQVCPQNLPSKSSYSNVNLNDMHHTASRFHWRQLEMSNLQRLLRNQSEDCLYLNIYTPLGNKTKTQNSRPVLVFIHGESFEWSSGSVYDGTALAAYGDIVVVLINYRLGVLGFFPSLDDTSRNNLGLMDQVAALHWVQENIAVFGGDPNNVTIAGHGHGASCVHLLMISSMAKGLFHRVIMQSGSAYSSWAFSSNALKYAYQLVEKVDCASSAQQTSNKTTDSLQPNTNSQIMQCLRSKTVEQLLAAQRQIQVPPHLSGFGPTIDGLLVANNFNQNFNNFNNFINQQASSQSANVHSNHPNQINHNNQANSLSNISVSTFQSFTSLTTSSASTIPLLIGLSRLDMRWNEFEAIFSSPEDRRNPILLKEKALKGLVKSLYTFHLNEIYLTIMNEYTDWSRNSATSLLDSIIETISDATIVAPLVRTALLHQRSQRMKKNLSSRTRLLSSVSKNEINSPASSTYFYCFAYLPDLPNQPIQDRAEPTHGSELAYLFGHPLLRNGTVGKLGYFPNRKYNRDEQHLSKQMINYWTNFMRTGNPNSAEDAWSQQATNSINSFAPFWPPYEEQQQQYLSISPKSSVRNNYHAHRLSFWLNLIPKLHTSGALDNKLHLMNSDHHDWSQFNRTSSRTIAASLLDSMTDAYSSGQLINNDNHFSMQKSINNSRLDRLPSNGLNGAISSSVNASRINLDHHYQKHQPQTHAGKFATKSGQQPNYVGNNQQQSNLLKKHVYANNDLDPLNLFHLPEHGNQFTGDTPQVISYEQAKSEQQMLNYYSKALMLTIIAGVVMFTLNISIFIILIHRKKRMNKKLKQDERQKQSENDEQSQKQLQQAGDHHLKMIDNEEFTVQYDDFMEHTQSDQLKKLSDNKISKNSVYNLQQNAVTLHEHETDLKWYTTSNHDNLNETGHHLPLTNWSNNYLLFEQHPEANVNYTTNALTNIDLNTLAIDTLNGKLNEVSTSYEDSTYNGHYRERETPKMSTIKQHHLNETDI